MGTVATIVSAICDFSARIATRKLPLIEVETFETFETFASMVELADTVILKITADGVRVQPPLDARYVAVAQLVVAQP